MLLLWPLTASLSSRIRVLLFTYTLMLCLLFIRIERQYSTRAAYFGLLWSKAKGWCWVSELDVVAFSVLPKGDDDVGTGDHVWVPWPGRGGCVAAEGEPRLSHMLLPQGTSQM